MNFKETLVAVGAAVLLYIPLVVVSYLYGAKVGELIEKIVYEICY